ncbi:hypothetical protein N7519_006951 [Penicillium mononematosum]|uniref:uncharacterized protein n=1 Tax=Penicillium mononematosum TaxID=268346 RepID=UPI002546E8E9|nr:uncharacterized protein N7519_006951 [Penicillium mononematosum]KAJ6185650.1 hypothetical protein N7519_006951 [Penicillium mononematosum]
MDWRCDIAHSSMHPLDFGSSTLRPRMHHRRELLFELNRATGTLERFRMPHKTNSTIAAVEQATTKELFNVILYDYAPYSAGIKNSKIILGDGKDNCAATLFGDVHPANMISIQTQRTMSETQANSRRDH